MILHVLLPVSASPIPGHFFKIIGDPGLHHAGSIAIGRDHPHMEFAIIETLVREIGHVEYLEMDAAGVTPDAFFQECGHGTFQLWRGVCFHRFAASKYKNQYDERSIMFHGDDYLTKC